MSGTTIRRSAAAIVLAALLGAGCGADDEPQVSAAQPSPPAPSTTVQAAAYPVTVKNCGIDFTYTKAPERVVSSSVPGTELLLALGLEKSIAGVVGATSVITPDLQPKMTGVNIITEKTFPPVGKEAVLAANPDFLIAGYSEDLADTAVGSQASLKSLSVNSYLVQGKCGTAKTTLDDTYADIENLGKIFNVKPAATALLAKLKGEVAAAPKATNRPKVQIHAAGKEKPSTSGASTLVADMVARAGGDYIYPEVPTFASFAWETFVERNPDIVVIVETASAPGAGTIEFMSSYEPIAGVNAVTAKKYLVVPVNDVQPGVRNGSAYAKIAAALASAK